jgi:hypothetical protein
MRYYREEYTDYDWYELMQSMGENLPNDYHDIFDIYGEISEKYSDIFNVDIYIQNKKEKNGITYNMGATYNIWESK